MIVMLCHYTEKSNLYITLFYLKHIYKYSGYAKHQQLNHLMVKRFFVIKTSTTLTKIGSKQE